MAEDEIWAIAVAVPTPLRRNFDYGITPNPLVHVGARVMVPFGRQQLIGMVVGAPRMVAAADYRLKPITAVLDEQPLAPEDWLETLRWAAQYYQYSLGEVIHSAMPAPLRTGKSLREPPVQAWQITESGIARLASHPRPSKARELLTALQAGPAALSTEALAEFAAGFTQAKAQAWITPAASAVLALESPLSLTPAQARASAELAAAPAGFSVTLLEGVTGSGKTELYLQRAALVLAQGLQVLVLVPEIGLTPLLLGRFADRFGAVVVAYHSGMTESERAHAWLNIRSQKAKVLVGTRSAVFAPFAKLGLVVVDEEHDTSFKQQDTFRYHARDVALFRAKKAGVAAILGSATPALESLAHALSGHYRHVVLDQRVGTKAPPVPQLIDLAAFRARHGLSEPLAQALEHHLSAGGQALIFINRRGYAPTLLCDDCGWVAPCPQCTARLTVHRRDHSLRCHHCAYTCALPQQCPSCASRRLVPVGEGSERVEEALKNRFPGKRIERFDSERLRARGAIEALFAEVRARRVDILVGTQLLTKGHDFPGISLVGVVNADTALYSADFRALERWGQQMTQVAGRAGRSASTPLPAQVLIQTREPRHRHLQTLLHHGYRGLAKLLLQERQETGLPPYGYLAVLRVESSALAEGLQFLQAAAQLWPGTRAQLLGPVPAPMERREGRFRTQLLLKAPHRRDLQLHLGAWLEALSALPGARKLRYALDVDPVDLF